VQDRLAGEFAIDKPAGDRADVAPWGFDRDLQPQLFGCDQIGEQREADAGPLDAISSRNSWRSAIASGSGFVQIGNAEAEEIAANTELVPLRHDLPGNHCAYTVDEATAGRDESAVSLA
jgi:hypothetical protein